MTTSENIVRNNVFVNVSTLVSELAKEAGALYEQAFDLSTPLDDWESAATDAGWRYECSRFTGQPSYVRDGERVTGLENGWQELCEDNGLEPHTREIFEHWIVSEWIAEKLEAKGERVDMDFAGLCVWGRTTTGQSIALDGVIEEIAGVLL